MDTLQKIITHKTKEVQQKCELFPIKLLEQSIYFETQPISLKKYILREDKSGIIAEIKRRSPSKGVINTNVSVERISIGYMQAGASALSVLTDTHFFGGSNEDLSIARKFNYCPILRKDFVIDEYQILEAKSIGADAVLLIAAVLERKKLVALAKLAKSLGLEVLLEVHNQEELQMIHEWVDIVGVNNRDLKTFQVDIQASLDLVQHIPNDIVKISESGLHEPEDVMKLKQCGFQGFLIGERLMQESRPEIACARFIEKLHQLEEKVYA